MRFCVERSQLSRNPAQTNQSAAHEPVPLDQRQLDFRLLTQRGGEADLRGVVSSYT